ncbi:MAG: hypothetical protein J6X24_04985, partial [Firmicutes bacterium]|nr:hypothetical protein [Bacillota bacterium]
DYADLSISLPMGIYVVTDDLYLRRRLHGAIIDTGAWMPFVTSRLASLLEPAGVQYADESPQFGSLRGEYLEGSITIPAADRDVSRRLRFGLLPDVLDRLGTFDAILGVTALTDKRLAFDFERKVLRIKL